MYRLGTFRSRKKQMCFFTRSKSLDPEYKTTPLFQIFFSEKNPILYSGQCGISRLWTNPIALRYFHRPLIKGSKVARWHQGIESKVWTGQEDFQNQRQPSPVCLSVSLSLSLSALRDRSTAAGWKHSKSQDAQNGKGDLDSSNTGACSHRMKSSEVRHSVTY